MTDIPDITPADVARWYVMQEELTKLKAAEVMLRTRIFKHYFPTPTEGSAGNKYELNDGTGAIVQGDHTINRKVVETEMEALKEAIKAEGSNLPKLPFAKLVRWKPELAKAEYNKLTAEEKAVFDRCLEIKPGTPALEVKIPKRP
jgi:hypothetical protein